MRWKIYSSQEKRVTANILKETDQIPDDFGTGPGVMKSGLADITLEK